MRMNLEEREALEEQCELRMQALASSGVMIPGIGTKLIASLICQLLTPEQEAEAKEEWLAWTCDQLDRAESIIRQRMLASGIVGRG